MRTKLNGILTLLLAFVVHLTFAQEKTITGTVTDQDGLPLPGVNIVVQGTTNGTQSDFDGNFSIKGSQGDILVFSYIGQKNKTVSIGASNTLKVQMQEDAQALEEVVVTAQGIKREKKALGYAITKIDGDEVGQKSSGDVGRLLQGKAAGVNITATNGLAGSSTNIVIRGMTSISGSNQPLFIVDGVPFDSGTNNQASFFDNVTESSRFLDLDPNNIENVNVLKGLSATTLYGQAGRNGVIVITTKNGSSTVTNDKMEVSITQSQFVTNPHLPNYQDEFGGGFNQNFGWFFSNWGPSFSDKNPASFGGAIADGGYYYGESNGVVQTSHPFASNSTSSAVSLYPELRDGPYEYKPYNSVEEFFRTGYVTSTSINIKGGGEKGSFNVNYGRYKEEGYIPENSLLRHNFGVGGRAQLANKFTADATLNFSYSDYKTPPLAASRGSSAIGDGTSIFGDVLYTPRNVDLMNLPYKRPDGGQVYYRTSINSIQHPLWTLENSKVTQETRRVFGKFGLNYELSDAVNIMYRIGLDTYAENGSYGQNKGGSQGNITGIYRTTARTNTIWDHTLQGTFTKDLNDDFNLSSIFGMNSRRNMFQQDGLESTQQIAYGTLKHYNFLESSIINSFSDEYIADEEIQNNFGIYADATLGYKDFLYWNVSARKDWSSTVEVENNSILYPATSISFIPTAAFNAESDFLTYLKIRAGYGTSANFPSPYGTRNTLVLDGRTFVPNGGSITSSNTLSDRLANADLKPETISEIELGVDSRLFNNNLGLNVSVFKKTTKDLITDKDLDPSTGYNISRINAGALEIKGIELDFDFTPIRLETGFRWKIDGNFYADENTVTELPEGVDLYYIGSGVIGDARNTAVVGQPFGVFTGSSVERTDEGEPIVTSDGLYQVDEISNSVIGDPNPDWTGSLTNTFAYNNLSLSVTMNYRQGGDIYSYTNGTIMNRGLVDFPLSRYQTYTLPGVKSDGNGGYVPNDIQINATNIAFDVLNYGADQFLVYDGTTIRLSDISLSYNLPSKFLDKTFFGALSFTFNASNVWFRSFNMPKDVNFDVNSSSSGVGNNMGLDYMPGPGIKKYGFSVKANF